MAFKFEKLIVWQKAVDLTARIHELTLRFPKDELYILSSQIKRATDSIALNISEGSTGQSDLEFKKFLGYAIRSGIEVITCLYIAKKRSLIDEKTFNEVYIEVEEIIKMTQSLRKNIN